MGAATGGDGSGRTTAGPVPFCSIITNSTAPLVSVASASRGARWNRSRNAASRRACRPSDMAAASRRRDLRSAFPRRPRASNGPAPGICISMAAAAAAQNRHRTAVRTPPQRQAVPRRQVGPRPPDRPSAPRRDAHNAAPGRARAARQPPVRPASAVARSRRMIACDAAGSRSAVGSSSRNTSGSVANARANMARRTSPPEMRSTRALRNASIPQSCKALVTGASAWS